jgi:hypothetical protein
LPDWSFWREIQEVFANAPEEELAKIPPDAASRLDEYLEGTIVERS